MRRTALVTGAARGIGRAVVAALADTAWVAALDRDFSAGPGDAAATFTGDVRDSATVRATVDDIVRQRSGLDWIVCAAGIVRDRVSWKMSDAEWADV
ncbi:MAG TPA: SDR family NAD(P)-dependent oxidoreductase, partial [Gemmatimonadales bacterium]|nr:SDR family NAD(P)-dependent oxidoreductase [Gemmatimonadales bacterium]